MAENNEPATFPNGLQERIISEPSELDELPFGSAVLKAGKVWQKRNLKGKSHEPETDNWYTYGSRPGSPTSLLVRGSVILVWLPKA